MTKIKKIRKHSSRMRIDSGGGGGGGGEGAGQSQSFGGRGSPLAVGSPWRRWVVLHGNVGSPSEEVGSPSRVWVYPLVPYPPPPHVDKMTHACENKNAFQQDAYHPPAHSPGGGGKVL